MGMITGDWLTALEPEFKKPYYAKLFQFVKKNMKPHRCFRLRTIFSMHFI